MAEKKFITCDGNYAAAHVAYMFSEVAAIYPITPSSTMAELVDEWAAQGRKNIFGETVKVVEMQSEAGAAGAVHGSLQSGALTSTFTASQGLLLMIPNMYKISGELLPGVFHVSARALAAQSLSIFGDHQDVMATRQTGFAMLATSSVQEVMDLAGVAHIVSLKSRVPFLHFFDGFRTSHEIQKIELIDEAALTAMLDRDALKAFRERALNPRAPRDPRYGAQNPDIYFQTREAANRFYDAVPDMVAEAMREISKITGREYKPFVYYGAADAENIVIAMGSVTETLRETVDYLNARGGKVGVVTVHLYRPFSVKYLGEVLPETVKRICVLDRTKEPGANGDPLYLDVVEAFANCKDIPADRKPLIIGGRYGLSSKDTTPAQMLAVFANLAANEPKNQFTVGIVDDVTFRSLPVGEEISLAKPGTFEALFFGLGADGTVGANKNSIKIIGGTTNKYCQAYFSYDSKKSGGYTSSHLRFGDLPITSPYLVTTPDFVACHVPSYVDKYDVLKGLKAGGSFLLNSVHDAATTCATLPDHMKAYLAKNKINFYIINATKIAAELGLGSRTNTIMQSAFFKIANVIPFDKAVDEMKHAILKSYGKKGEDIVNMNYAAVDAGGNAVVKVEVPAEWAQIDDNGFAHVSDASYPEFVRKVVEPINGLKGDDLPVSAFTGREDGTWENGTAAYEKRGIAVNVPEWKIENCIQCNQCAYVCPHAVIRPFLATEAEAAASGVEWKQGLGETKEYKFRIQISPLDCTGCSNCVDVCPAKEKALVMRPSGGADAPAEELGLHHQAYRLQAGRRQDQVGEEPPVRTAAVRVLGRLRRLRRDPLYQGYLAAVRRQDDGCQRHGLYLDLFGFGTVDPVLHQRQGPGPGMGELAFRGQRRIRPGYAPRCRETSRPYPEYDGAGYCQLYEMLRRAEGRHAGVDRFARFVGQIGRGLGAPRPDDGGLRLRLLQGYPGDEGLAGEEVAVDHRRRRLGVRYRLRRCRSRAGIGPGCEHSGRGYRGLLEYRRTVVEIDARGCRRQVRFGRQAYPQERPRRHRHDLRLRIRGAGFDRRFADAVVQRAQGGRGLSRPVARDRLCSVYQPRHQGRHDAHADRGQGGRSLRLLAPVALQPAARGAGQEPVRDGLEGARLVEVPRLPDEGGALHFAQKSFPAEADELFAAAEENAKWRYNGYQRLAKMEY